MLLLTAADLALGECPPPDDVDLPEGRRIVVDVLEIPAALFEVPKDERSQVLREFVAAYREASLIDMMPEFIQEQDEDDIDGDFLFQFDERLVDINLGDVGVMYVFTTTAFSQSH